MPLSSNSEVNGKFEVMKGIQSAYFRHSLNNPSVSSVMLDTDGLFSQDPSMKQIFATAAFLYLSSKVTFKDRDAVWKKNYSLLALMGVSLSSLLFAINSETDEVDLITTSISVLHSLSNSGLLISKDKGSTVLPELKKINEAITSASRLELGLSENALFAVRLERFVEGDKVNFTMTVPKKRYAYDKYIFVPYVTYALCGEMLKAYLSDNLVRIISTYKGITGYVNTTRNKEVLLRHYPVEKVNLSLFTCNEPILRAFHTPVYGEAITNFGVKNIRLEFIDSITNISESEIDFSLLNVDLTKVYSFFESCVLGFSPDQIKSMTDMYTSAGVVSTEDARSRVLHHAAVGLSWSDLYRYVRRRADLFDLSAMPRFASSSAVSRLPSIPSTAEELEAYLRDGAYSITIRNEKGISTYVVTLDERELIKGYGNDYMAKYESIGVRVRACLAEMGSNRDSGILSSERLTYYVAKYNLYELSLTHDVESIKVVLTARADKAAAYVAKKVKNPDCATARQLNIQDPSQYFKQINVKNIMTIDRLGLGGVPNIDKSSFIAKSNPTADVLQQTLKLRNAEPEAKPEVKSPVYAPTAYFFRKIETVAELRAQTQDAISKRSEGYSGYQIAKVIDLPLKQWSKFSKGLLNDADFLKDSREFAGEVNSRTIRCILVRPVGSRWGVLVNTEGYDYARYAAMYTPLYVVKVKDDCGQELKGNFKADSSEAASKQAKVFYAQALDTVESSIDVVSVGLVKVVVDGEYY